MNDVIRKKFSIFTGATNTGAGSGFDFHANPGPLGFLGGSIVGPFGDPSDLPTSKSFSLFALVSSGGSSWEFFLEWI